MKNLTLIVTHNESILRQLIVVSLSIVLLFLLASFNMSTQTSIRLTDIPAYKVNEVKSQTSLDIPNGHIANYSFTARPYQVIFEIDSKNRVRENTCKTQVACVLKTNNSLPGLSFLRVASLFY